MGRVEPFTASDDKWLSSLVDTFERTEQLHDETCDPAVLSAAMARLQRPAAPRHAEMTPRETILELSF